MVTQEQLALNDATEWLGDWHPLAEQLGSASGLVTLGSVSSLLDLPPVEDLESLKGFLRNYYTRILVPAELPAIYSAYGHAAGNELRELVALDQQLAADPVLQTYAAPSRRIGQSQLQKLRPLRDQRFVRRYLRAVETRQAHGWHTLVYGVTMEIYSLPLRQGLLGYAHQTSRGFIYSAARMLRASEQECRAVFDEVAWSLPAAVESVLLRHAAA